MRRGNYNSLQDQALKLTNNTENKWTKKSPEEALLMSDAELAPLYNKGRAKNKPYKGAGPKVPKVGSKARHLVSSARTSTPS